MTLHERNHPDLQPYPSEEQMVWPSLVAPFYLLQLALASTSVSQVIQTTKWIIPLLQTIHILAIASSVFPPLSLFDLRLWQEWIEHAICP